MKKVDLVLVSIALTVTFDVLSDTPNRLTTAKVLGLTLSPNKLIQKPMSELDAKAAYVADMAKAAKFLPTRFVKEVKQKLPEKSIARIKNARSGIVQDYEVLAVLQQISERERLRRLSEAQKELAATLQVA